MLGIVTRHVSEHLLICRTIVPAKHPNGLRLCTLYVSCMSPMGLATELRCVALFWMLHIILDASDGVVSEMLGVQKKASQGRNSQKTFGVR